MVSISMQCNWTQALFTLIIREKFDGKNESVF